ncbi:MAG TPA: alpha/beta hydrolase [Chthoniobacteraceae bacterium]|jgi:acetyl esterase/lipase|nr:alpha/beta hydrolase [Chthoniobacteraceae bacterium]
MKRNPLIVAAIALLSGCASITPPPHGESILRNLVYAHRPTGDLHLDLYLPAQPAPHPLVIWIHGGGWKYGDKGWMLYVRKLTRYGFAVASVQYRLSYTAKYPAQIEDCRAALHWLEETGPAYGLDRRHYFLSGASAGGHLAALLAEEVGRREIKAVCVLYPATDLTGFGNQQAKHGYLPDLLGGTVIEKRALAEDASPVNHVTADAPPFLFFHGDKDGLVPLEQSRELDQKLRAAGVESHLVVVAGKGHGFPLTDAQLREVAAFFRQHWD